METPRADPGLNTDFSESMCRPDKKSNPSPFLDKLGCRKPKMQVSARNIPQMDDDDDLQIANLYYGIYSYKTEREQNYHDDTFDSVEVRYQVLKSEIKAIKDGFEKIECVKKDDLRALF